MVKFLSALSLLILLSLSAACSSVQTDTRSLCCPVLVGPVNRIGNHTGNEALGRKVGEVEAEVSRFFSAASSTTYENHGGTVYRVQETHTSSGFEDTIQSNLYRKTGGNPDRIVKLDWIRGAAISGFYLCAGWGEQYITIEGTVWDPKL